MGSPLQPLIESLFGHAERSPHRVALVVGTRLLTYAQLKARVIVTAHRLKAAGIDKGDRVLLMGSNHDDLAVAYFAVHAAGAIAVPVEPTLPTSDLNFVVNDAEPSVALVDGDQHVSIRTESIHEFTCDTNGSSDWNLVAAADDAADILYTTGTTGRKKGVLLTHANIAAAAQNIVSFIGNQESDLEVVPVPLSHSFGLGRLRCMALLGNTVALEPGIRNPATLLKRVFELRANGIALVPTGFELILGLTRDKIAEAGDHLRYIEIGSAPIRQETCERLIKLLPNTRICHHYGLTEASRACFREFHADQHKPGSVGKPSPNVTVTIVNDSGDEVARGEVGEIVIHGAMTIKKYWKRPDLDAKSFVGSGFKTNDVGRVDEDGYVYLQGRRSEIINVGGLKVAPQEIESLLDGRVEIVDCACIGVPDNATGEKIKLFYVANRELDSREIIKWLRDNLEEYKIPKVFERIDKIPRTQNGKILRRLLVAESLVK